jgi:hypothetical protein
VRYTSERPDAKGAAQRRATRLAPRTAHVRQARAGCDPIPPLPCSRAVPGTVYSIGHSTLDADALQASLAAHGIACVADVRAFPGSRRHPQFAREALARACREHGVGYRWLPGLGGRRRSASPASPHVAWRVAAFRAYADYADGPEFAAALA